jgi:hypothetical protein
VGPFRLAALGLGFGWFCVLAGCTGGQSGTETPHPNMPDAQVPPDIHDNARGPDSGGALPPTKAVDTNQAVVACACTASSEHAVLLRATLQFYDLCMARARVDEVLSPAQAAVMPGDVVGGTLPGFGKCGRGIDFSVGDSVLLVYTRGTQDGENCAEQVQCIAQQCDKRPAPESDGGDCFAQCAKDTRAACAAHADEARLGGQLVVARDADSVVMFGDAISIPKSEIDRVLDPGMCSEWFMQHGDLETSQVPGCSMMQ